jgi:predicted 2-oxoglutarate/Fe(II)-dependent dioxygenase YbiX
MKIYKNILSDKFCDFLIETIKIECVLNEVYKKNNWYVWFIWGQGAGQKFPKEKWNEEILNLIKTEFTKNNFNYDTIIKTLLWLQMTEYQNNRFLRRHTDGAYNKTIMIILSNNFVGGETYIDDKKIDLKKGDGIIFDGHNQYHEIKPVTDGTRYALNFWFK